MRSSTTSTSLAASMVLVASYALAQTAPVPDPLVKENATVKLAAHTYVIPDGNVGLVPNVGIIVGSRGTLVIDPGLGRRNGEVRQFDSAGSRVRRGWHRADQGVLRALADDG